MFIVSMENYISVCEFMHKVLWKTAGNKSEDFKCILNFMVT